MTDVIALQDSVRNHCVRHAANMWPAYQLVDGPLHGMQINLDPPETRVCYVGFCRPTSIGLVQVFYKRANDAIRVLRFESIDWPKCRIESIPQSPFVTDSNGPRRN